MPLHPSRFRPNIILDGMPAWHEFTLVNRTIRIGSCLFKVLKRTIRCDATHVDPQHTIGVDENAIDVPALLQQHWPEHGPYLGIYAQVIAGLSSPCDSLTKESGTISVGDTVSVLQ